MPIPTGAPGSTTSEAPSGYTNAQIDYLAKYNTAGTSDDGIFADFMVFNEYENDAHTYMMGVTSPEGFQGASVAFCQLASPTTLWVCRWTACKAGGQPEIPSPITSDPNWVLLDTLPQTAMQGLMPDGVTPLFRISGVYVYGHKKPAAGIGISSSAGNQAGSMNGVAAFTDMRYPRPVWQDDDFTRTIDLNKLQQNVIDVKGSRPPVGLGVAIG